MSEVKEITYSDDDSELDQLLDKVNLMEPDSDYDDDGGNDVINVHGSQVLLFATVRSPTDVPLISETGLAPGEERRKAKLGRSMPATSPYYKQKRR